MVSYFYLMLTGGTRYRRAFPRKRTARASSLVPTNSSGCEGAELLDLRHRRDVPLDHRFAISCGPRNKTPRSAASPIRAGEALARCSSGFGQSRRNCLSRCRFVSDRPLAKSAYRLLAVGRISAWATIWRAWRCTLCSPNCCSEQRTSKLNGRPRRAHSTFMTGPSPPHFPKERRGVANETARLSQQTITRFVPFFV